MESPEEFTGSNDHHHHHHHHILKGKRTKRQRTSSPVATAVTSSSSSGGGGGGGGGVYFSFPSPTTSSEISTTTQEDEDMANCLILLAQSGRLKQERENIAINTKKFSSPKNTDTVYECKNCNRSFPTFQALGGHRASHKKLKAMMLEKKDQTTPFMDEEEEDEERKYSKISPPLSLHVIKQSKVHECSICGSEFSSGQALGGHMRRHRTQITMNSESSTTELTHQGESKPRSILSLDLNLPAPEDDPRDSTFPFTPDNHHLVFSAAALVGCHY